MCECVFCAKYFKVNARARISASFTGKLEIEHLEKVKNKQPEDGGTRYRHIFIYIIIIVLLYCGEGVGLLMVSDLTVEQLYGC